MASFETKPRTTPFQRLLSARRVAGILNCSDRLVYQMVQEGRLEAYRIGKTGIRIPKEAVLKYLKDNKVDPEAQYELKD
ncbi:MAG: helix-turn-helix domain-containing protein [Syntrophobacteraceae bacterium]